MLREKSCGALVYRKRKEKYELLLIKHKSGGHWSFPKGHVESGENELQTALREIKEETGLDVRLMDGFRQSVEYFPKPHVKKQVVYFWQARKQMTLSPNRRRRSATTAGACWMRRTGWSPSAMTKT